VENDGFNLGAQRRPIDKNDLPQVLAEVNEYLRRLRAKESVAAEDFTPTRGLIVTKEKIAANGDYNLSGERYREGGARSHSFPHVTLAEVCTINPPKSEGLSMPPETLISFVPMSDLGENRMTFTPKETKRIEELGSSYTYFANGDVLVAKVTPCFENGKAGIARNLTNGVGFGSSEFYVLRPSDRVLAEFVYFCISHRQFREPAIEQMTGTGGLQRVPKSYVETFEIPLPPLEVQKEIVAEIEGYQRVIDGARAVLDHYRPHIPIQPDWPMVLIGDVVEFVSGLTVSIPEVESEGGTPILAINNVTEEGELTLEGIRYISPPTKTLNYVKKGDLLFNWRNGSRHLVGKTALFDLDGDYLFASFLLGIRPDTTKVDSRYLWHTLNSYRKDGKYSQFMRENVNGLFNREELKITRIPLPPLAVQREIVSEIEAERRLVEANRELIARMETKIAATLARIWGEDGKASPPDPAGGDV